MCSVPYETLITVANVQHRWGISWVSLGDILSTVGGYLEYCWVAVAKNEDVFNKFYEGLHGRSWKNPLRAQTSIQKVNFFQLETNRPRKNNLLFSSLKVQESNFHPWTLWNSEVKAFWPLTLEHYLKFVLNSLSARKNQLLESYLTSNIGN